MGIFNGINTSGKIKAVLAAHDVTFKGLAVTLGLTPETITTRMRENNWKLQELKAIASIFEIDVGDLV